MSWSLRPKGSWGEATTSAPATEMAAALALPGSWRWYPAAATVLVRKDQWLNLPALPRLDSINPTSGTAAGGVGVVASGLGLTGSTALTFDGTPGTSFSVVNDGSVSALTPAHVPGPAAVVVVNPRGNATSPTQYTFT